MFRFSLEKNIIYHFTYLLNHKYSIYLLCQFFSFGLSGPSVVMSEQPKGNTTAQCLQAHRVPAEEEDTSPTVQFQGSSECDPLLQVSYRIRKDVVSYENSAPLRTMKTMQRKFCEENLVDLSIST